jgi:hypothetical protein
MADTKPFTKKAFYVAIVGAVVAILWIFGLAEPACNILDSVGFKPEICAEIVIATPVAE